MFGTGVIAFSIEDRDGILRPNEFELPFFDLRTLDESFIWNLDATPSQVGQSDAFLLGFGNEIDLGEIFAPGLAFTPEELASELDRYWYAVLGEVVGDFELVIDLPTPGDLDLDGDIDSRDTTVLFSNWTGALLEGGGKRYIHGDVDLDGDVDSADATLLVQNWTGATLGNVSVVPEPNAGILLWVAALLVGARFNLYRK